MTEYINPETGESFWTGNTAEEPPLGFIPAEDYGKDAIYFDGPNESNLPINAPDPSPGVGGTTPAPDLSPGVGETTPMPNEAPMPNPNEASPISSELTDGRWREDHPLGTVWEGDMETSADGSVGRWIMWEDKWMFEGDNGWMYDKGSQQWLFPQSGGNAWNDKVLFQTTTGEFYSADQVAKLSPDKWTNLAEPIQQENLDFIAGQTPEAPQQQIFDQPPAQTQAPSPGLEQIFADPNLSNPPEVFGGADPILDPRRSPPENVDDIIAEINEGFPPGLQDGVTIDPTEGTNPYDWTNPEMVLPDGTYGGGY